jgi:putative oxidoreductase
VKIAALISRILIGIAFVVAGAFGWILTFGSGPPAMPGLAGEFQRVIFQSHYVLFVDTVQLLAGLALLANRFVPLALVISAAFFYNILAFHITMLPAAIGPGAILTICWFIVALSMRDRLSPLLTNN